jgi:hypothetical protein
VCLYRYHSEERSVTRASQYSQAIDTAKAKHLEPLKDGKIPLEILIKGKDPAESEKIFKKVAGIIKSSGVRMATHISYIVLIAPITEYGWSYIQR